MPGPLPGRGRNSTLLLAVALLDLGLYSIKNEEFWNSEVGRAAVENTLVKQEDQREKE